jgi:excisionase family DNA binding protein
MFSGNSQGLDEKPDPLRRSQSSMPDGSHYVTMKGEPVLLFDKTSSNSDPAAQLLTVRQAAELLRVSATSVRRLQERRLLAFIKVGGSIRFSMNDIVAYLEKQRVEPIDT